MIWLWMVILCIQIITIYAHEIQMYDNAATENKFDICLRLYIYTYIEIYIVHILVCVPLVLYSLSSDWVIKYPYICVRKITSTSYQVPPNVTFLNR